MASASVRRGVAPCKAYKEAYEEAYKSFMQVSHTQIHSRACMHAFMHVRTHAGATVDQKDMFTDVLAFCNPIWEAHGHG